MSDRMKDVVDCLSKIITERYAKDVRQAIHDAIYQCYYDSKVGSLDFVARQQIANLVSQNNPTEGNSELIDIRVGTDGIIYDSAGEAVRQQITDLADKITEILTDDTKEFASVEFDEEFRTLHFYDESGLDVYEPVYISGGGTGSTASTVVKLLNQNGTSTFSVPYGKPVELKFIFTSTEDDIPTGNGSCEISVDGVTKTTFDITQGTMTPIDVSKFLHAGSNTVRVKCTDIYGNYKTLIYTVIAIEMYVTSTFDATIPYSENIAFKYTPYGAIEKTIHILVDDDEIATSTLSTSGKQTTQIIPKMSHGVHRLELYMTSDIYGESDHLIYDVICVEENNTTPMIASAYGVKSIKQGELVSIPYIVYDPTKLSCDITLDIYTMKNGSEVKYSTHSITVDRNQRFLNTRKYPTGTVYFRIKYGDITKIHTLVVSESDINKLIEVERNDLELYLTSEGRSNDEATPSNWGYENVKTTFSNVDWTSNGWKSDENGDTCLRLSGDAKAEIQFKPFSGDIRTYGKTIELVFAIRDVIDRDAVAIKCMSGGIGFEVKPNTAYIASEQSKVFCNYIEDEKVHLSFVVESRKESRLLSIYLNGILSDVVQYTDNDNFQQNPSVNITIGSEYCSVDLYVIRSYSTALTSPTIVNNFLADTTDISTKTILHEANDIYDEYGKISFEKAKKRNSVMVITGALPKAQEDRKNVKISYYDLDNPSINYIDNLVVIDVQGTSSQYYVRKNWKLECSEPHYIDANQLPAKVLCIKVDYAESTGTHNTQNANLVHTLYKEPIPPQVTETRTRTTIYGKPILLFYQETEGEDPIFYGKANYNYDKGAEHVFGFTSDYDVECWEFRNSTSNACNFLGTIPDDWSNDFKARYPDKHKDISRFKIMHDWVVSTKDNIDKFKTEFEDYFDLHYSLIYYVYTFFALMTDQRAKNMFLTYWGSTGKWQPWFYDNDTCFGINNWGELLYDYYHEDTDQLNGENIYTGQNSLLWSNFREAFADKIKETYQNLRKDGYITYDKMIDRFITKGSDKWCESIYNEDGEFKYISMLRSDNDGANLFRLRGSGEEHFKYFIKNRINYCDSKWYASDYADDYVSLRISTPTKWTGIEPKADIKVTAYNDMYAGVKYTASSSIIQEKVSHGQSVTFKASENDVFTGTETIIFGASQLTSIGDLAPLYCGSVDVSKAIKLTELKIGNSTAGYSNPNLKELSLGTNKFLKKIDIRNCPNLAISLDLSECTNLEEIYADGSAITGIEFANNGRLKKATLPSTVTNLTIKNQKHIEEITSEGYAGLKTLWVENCPTFNTLAVLAEATSLERARLTDVNWSYPDASVLVRLAESNIAGIDENGINTGTMWIDGTCHIEVLAGSEMATINEAFPHLTITYDTLAAKLTYKSWDGKTVLYTELIQNGGNGTCPSTAGNIPKPTRASTAQYDYTFGGWSKNMDDIPDLHALQKVEADRIVYAAFNHSLRYYSVKFYSGTTLLQTVTAGYGSDAVYTGEPVTKTDVDDPTDFDFIGWSPEPTDIKGDTVCYAKFYDSREISDSWATIVENCNNGSATRKYEIGSYKSLDITLPNGTVDTVEMQVVAHNHDELADNWIGKWIPITTAAGSSSPSISSSSIVISYNNEIHSIGYNHYAWSESGWREASTLYFYGNPTAGIVYNDALHLFGSKYSSSETAYYHYSWNGAEWREESTLPFAFASGCAVVLEDKIHLFGGSVDDGVNRCHYTWDGSSWTKQADLPFDVNANCCAVVCNERVHIFCVCSIGTTYAYRYYFSENKNATVFYAGVFPYDPTETLSAYSRLPSVITLNNEIHILGGGANTMSHYKTIGGSDKNIWTDMQTLPCKNNSSGYISAVTHNNNIHILRNDEHYAIHTPAFENLEPLPYGTSYYNYAFEKDSELYITSNNAHLYKWDGIEWSDLGMLPFKSQQTVMCLYNGELYAYKNTSSTGDEYYMRLYKYNFREWTEVCTLPMGGYCGSLIEYEGCLHMIGGYYVGTKAHYSWDGTTWTFVGDLPCATTGAALIVDGITLEMFTGNDHYSYNGYRWNKCESCPWPTNSSPSTAPWKITRWNDLTYILIGSEYLYETDCAGGWNRIPLPAECDVTHSILVTFRDKLHILGGQNSLNQHYAYNNKRAVLTFMAKKPLSLPSAMRNYFENFTGWSGSLGCDYVSSIWASGLPPELKDNIKTVIKLTTGGYSSPKESVRRLFEYVWIPSCDEVGIDTINGSEIIGRGLGDTYPVFVSDSTRRRPESDNPYEEGEEYWLRSSKLDTSTDTYAVVTGSGSGSYKNASEQAKLVIGFCM